MKPTSTSLQSGYWQQLRKPLELEVARECPDTAIAGASIGSYAQLWAQRQQDASSEDIHLALSLARGLRDYATMPATERRRRAMAAIDLLRQREEKLLAPALPAGKPTRKSEPTATKRGTTSAVQTPVQTLPVGHELLEMPIEQLALRAKWPRLLANNLGIYTVRDLLYHIPRDWVDIVPICAPADGARVALVGTVTSREHERLRSKTAPRPLYKYTLTIHDETGEAWITSISTESDRGGGQQNSWSPTKLAFRVGQRVFVMGKVNRTGKIVDVHMEDIFAVTEDEWRLLQPGVQVPVYPLTAGVYQNQVHRAILRALSSLGASATVNALIDPLPAEVREQFDLLPLLEALQELHQPRTPRQHELARKRLAFEEFLIPQLLLAQQRWDYHHRSDTTMLCAPETLPELVSRLVPFVPTQAQLRVLGEIEADMRGTRPMHRLLQGDVGSGKTLVAAGALAFAVRSGVQAAMMAPTEILAEQLYLVLTHLLAPLGITPVLLTGSQSPIDRRAALEALQQGTAPIAVGTQALIQEGVKFHNLGLTIVDEQHRFGVQQRTTLREKGRTPHALIMTATPIPRTLALTAYGDLDVSILDELPPGRHPVETRWMSNTDLRAAYQLLREQVTEGHQVYVLCPLVEQSELLQADAATEMAEELRRVFPDFCTGLLHGRLRPEEKDTIMESFRCGKIQILACTTVIEVGVDVPNATVMLIHSAERFGLAQLHQLRGRVGRSQHKSVCLLATPPRFNPASNNPEDDLPARKRLQTLLQEQDGFIIAQADLELRGPGEYLGARQSGLLEYKIGSLLRDGQYLEHARKAAYAIISADPKLAAPAYAELRNRVQRLKGSLEQNRLT